MKSVELQETTGDLPIWEAWPQLRERLVEESRVILVAPPGAGKSSVVPLALLDEPWLRGQSILLLEPRRLAARALASRMADLLGESLGGTVGLRTRDETRISAKTRIEVLTEALLTRRLQSDPELEGVGIVIFDEFHERSLHADLGLALARDVQQGLREDLRILLMSATLDEKGLAASLEAPVVRSEGRSYPVEIRHHPLNGDRPLEAPLAQLIRRCLQDEDGSILVFLPGEGEIRRLAGLLTGLPPACEVHTLYGRAAKEEQRAAIAPPRAGQRKVVLATSVAETSLTISGVRIVIDSGLARVPVFDANAGFTHLRTQAVSRDSADQRAGRAGRLEPGLCLRLWSADQSLNPVREAEIRQGDLSALLLNVAAWGSEPLWLEAPPKAARAQATALLQALHLLDHEGRILPAGRQVVEWGAHPRLGRMLLGAGSHAPMACDLSAMLEADRRQDREIDIHRAWLNWRRSSKRDPALERDAQRWRRRLQAGDEIRETDPGPLLALAFPDRIARARGERGRFLLANGRGARLPEGHPLAASEFLVVLELDGAREATIRLAAPYDETQLRAQFSGDIKRRVNCELDAESGAVRAIEQTVFGALVLSESRLARPGPEVLSAALCAGIRQMGLDRLVGWSDGSQQLRLRLAYLQTQDPSWPMVDSATLEAELDQWLGPFLAGLHKLSQITPAMLCDGLLYRLSSEQRRRLDQLAPAQVQLPGGRAVKLDYAGEDGPILAARVQDFYGVDATPLVAGRPVLLHLLSPARRPIAVTRDLPSFWRNAWIEVRKQMRGRYPKHKWPEQPWLPQD